MVDSSKSAPLTETVTAALAAREGGATDAEIRRVTKTLSRLQPAATDAGAERPARADDFDEALRALADA